jgi:hypothetical protein
MMNGRQTGTRRKEEGVENRGITLTPFNQTTKLLDCLM